MDKEAAREKEAQRTLNRIRNTLNQLDDGSAWQDPVSENEEFQRIRQLVESGYSHDKPGILDLLKTVIRHPAFLVLLGVVILVFVELMQR